MVPWKVRGDVECQCSMPASLFTPQSVLNVECGYASLLRHCVMLAQCDICAQLSPLMINDGKSSHARQLRRGVRV